MFKGLKSLLLATVVSMSAVSAHARLSVRGDSPAETQTTEYEIGAIDRTEMLEIEPLDIEFADLATASIDTIANYEFSTAHARKPQPPSIYSLPYSMTLNVPDWKKLWINSAVYAGAFGGTLLVLECLPEDATTWNRASLQSVPAGQRWVNHVFKKGPEWDHDKFYFNYILHPYAGAVYFMAARSAGFNFWRSFLYCSIVSNIGWEFGIEAFMERPSYQDLVITPVVGSIIGECFYKLKRKIAADHYRLCGSPVLGNIVALLIDPVNELTGMFGHNRARRYYRPDGSAAPRPRVQSALLPTVVNGAPGFSFTCVF